METTTEKRYCKFIGCGSELPDHSRKLYCPGTDCYKKQNRIDQAHHRERRRREKKLPKRTCSYDHCNEEFDGVSRQAYCCPEHRELQTEINRQNRINRVKVENTNGKKKIDPKFLTRGKITYEGYTKL